MDGVFFPQLYFEVPEKKMTKHASDNMMVPAPIFAYFIMIHAKLAFRFFKTLLNSPPDTA